MKILHFLFSLFIGGILFSIVISFSSVEKSGAAVICDQVCEQSLHDDVLSHENRSSSKVVEIALQPPVCLVQEHDNFTEPLVLKSIVNDVPFSPPIA